MGLKAIDSLKAFVVWMTRRNWLILIAKSEIFIIIKVYVCEIILERDEEFDDAERK